MTFNMFGPNYPQQGLRMPNGPALGLTMGSPSSPGSQPGVPGLQVPPGLAQQMNAPLMRYAYPGQPVSPMALMQLANMAGVGQQPQQPLPMPYRAPVMPTNPYKRRSLFTGG